MEKWGSSPSPQVWERKRWEVQPLQKKVGWIAALHNEGAWLSCTVSHPSFFQPDSLNLPESEKHRAEGRKKYTQKGLRAPINRNYRISPNSGLSGTISKWDFPNVISSRPMLLMWHSRTVGMTHIPSLYWYPFHMIWYFRTYYFEKFASWL